MSKRPNPNKVPTPTSCVSGTTHLMLGTTTNQCPQDEGKNSALAMAALSIFLAQLVASLLSLTRDFFDEDFGKPVSQFAQPMYIFSSIALFFAVLAAALWTLMYINSGVRTHVVSRAAAILSISLSLSCTIAEGLHVMLIILLRNSADFRMGYFVPAVIIAVLLVVLLLVFRQCGWDFREFLALCCGDGRGQRRDGLCDLEEAVLKEEGRQQNHFQQPVLAPKMAHPNASAQ